MVKKMVSGERGINSVTNTIFSLKNAVSLYFLLFHIIPSETNSMTSVSLQSANTFDLSDNELVRQFQQEPVTLLYGKK